MWALMDHDAQLMEDFMHANLDAPGVPLTPGPIVHPAVMVRPPLRVAPLLVPSSMMTRPSAM